MKTFVLLCVVGSLATATYSMAQERHCQKLQSSAEQDRCLQQETQDAEDKMNEMLEQALSEYMRHHDEDLSGTPMVKHVVEEEDLLTVAALKQSQTDWRAYRDSTCSAVLHSYDGGTSAAWAAEMCRWDLTKQRTKWLKSNFETEAARGQSKTKHRSTATPH